LDLLVSVFFSFSSFSFSFSFSFGVFLEILLSCFLVRLFGLFASLVVLGLGFKLDFCYSDDCYCVDSLTPSPGDLTSRKFGDLKQSSSAISGDGIEIK
jgi:hypothetical protein